MLVISLNTFRKSWVFNVSFFFLKSLNITCVTIDATLRMVETGEGGVGDERRKGLGKV